MKTTNKDQHYFVVYNETSAWVIPGNEIIKTNEYKIFKSFSEIDKAFDFADIQNAAIRDFYQTYR